MGRDLSGQVRDPRAAALLCCGASLSDSADRQPPVPVEAIVGDILGRSVGELEALEPSSVLPPTEVPVRRSDQEGPDESGALARESNVCAPELLSLKELARESFAGRVDGPATEFGVLESSIGWRVHDLALVED
jgi:hypothetical protein